MGFVYILPKQRQIVRTGSPSAALQGLSEVGHPAIGYPASSEMSGIFLRSSLKSFTQRNIKPAEGLRLRLPDARSLLRSTPLSRKCLSKSVWKERRELQRGVEESHFHQPGFQDGWEPGARSCYTPLKRALFASSHLPLPSFSLRVFEMKEFFLPNCAARQILERCNRKC